jgi:hypothetical protein
VKLSRSKKNEDALTMPDVAIYLSPIGFIFSWIVFFVIVQKIRNHIENKMVFRISILQKFPCKNCQYYSNNPFIKCAVEPSIVLTAAAKNCSGYSSKGSVFSPKNLFHKDNDFD